MRRQGENCMERWTYVGEGVLAEEGQEASRGTREGGLAAAMAQKGQSGLYSSLAGGGIGGSRRRGVVDG